MNYISKVVTAAALIGMVGLVNQGTLHAEEAGGLVTLKPISGAAVAGGAQPTLLDLTVGTKQALGYFHTEKGVCNLTIMVAEAFNAVEVSNSAAVRFQVALGAGSTARMDTAEGKSLEFACQAQAQEMIVRMETKNPTYPPGT